tara:strand:- start:2783 stop:3010 length:228 start_codon:yes stop_codon:yes gene_type:complete
MIPFFLKILTPKVLKQIMEYVFEKNDLDYKVDGLIERVDKVEKDSHPPVFTQRRYESIVDDIESIKKQLKKRNKK